MTRSIPSELAVALMELDTLVCHRVPATRLFPLVHALKWCFASAGDSTAAATLRRIEWLCDSRQDPVRANLLDWHAELARQLSQLLPAKPPPNSGTTLCSGKGDEVQALTSRPAAQLPGTGTEDQA